jgi:DNA-directed RNA polymerase subunit RPC12/RpoP
MTKTRYYPCPTCKRALQGAAHPSQSHSLYVQCRNCNLEGWVAVGKFRKSK